MLFSSNKSYFIYPLDTIILFVPVFAIFTLAVLFMFLFKYKKGIKKPMILWLLSWLIAGTLMFNFGCFGRFIKTETINSKLYTEKELVQDLFQLEKYLMNETPLYYGDKENLEILFKNAYESIEDDMSELEFYRLINPIAASVNCGHTNLSVSEALMLNREQRARFFPLKVTLAEDKLYFLENDFAAGICAGDEVKSINGLVSEEIIDILLKNISGDGNSEAKRRYIISKYFNSRFYDYIDNSDNFNVVFINDDGQKKTVILEAKYRNDFNTTAWDLHFKEYRDRNYYEAEFCDNYAVLDINLFMNEKNNKFDSFLDDFFIKMENRNIHKLIIDLRGNFGGDSFMAKALLSHLTNKEIEYFDCDLPIIYNLSGFMKPIIPKEQIYNGEVAVLTDGAVFSTAAHLSSLIKCNNLGIIIGGDTGGGSTCMDSAKDAVLNNTRIRLHYSTLVFKVRADEELYKNIVKPDISVNVTIDDILSNKDVIMETGLKALNN